MLSYYILIILYILPFVLLKIDLYLSLFAFLVILRYSLFVAQSNIIVAIALVYAIMFLIESYQISKK